MVHHSTLVPCAGKCLDEASPSSYNGYKPLWPCASGQQSQCAFSICLLALGAPTCLPPGGSFSVCSVPPFTTVHSFAMGTTPCSIAAPSTASSMQHKPYNGCSLLTDSSSWVLCRSSWIFLIRGRQKPIAISSFSSLLIPYSCRNKITDTLSPGSLPYPRIKAHLTSAAHSAAPLVKQGQEEKCHSTLFTFFFPTYCRG